MGLAGLFFLGDLMSQSTGTVEEAGRVSAEFNAHLVKGLAEAGELARAAEVVAFVSSLPGVKREDALTAYVAIQQAAPALSYERRKDLTRAVAPLAPTGIDLNQIGTLVGELAEMAPGKTAGDVADLALGMQETAGREAADLTSKSFLRYVRAEQAKRKRPIEEILAEGVVLLQAGFHAEEFPPGGRPGTESQVRPPPPPRSQLVAATAAIVFGLAGLGVILCRIGEELEILTGSRAEPLKAERLPAIARPGPPPSAASR